MNNNNNNNNSNNSNNNNFALRQPVNGMKHATIH